jgi:transcriptional regulator with XRE-family HTH domain
MKDVDPTAFGRRVATRRSKLGLSQDELAKRVGMKQQGIDAIEQGRVKRPRLLKELARTLHTSEDWLLWRKGPEDRSGQHPGDSADHRIEGHIVQEHRRVPAGQEFDPDPDHDRPATLLDRPFPDALPQMSGRMGGGSTGAVITIDVGEMQSREEVGEWWRIPPSVLRGLARADVSCTVGFVMDGDSMEPTIQRTDIVFIDTARQKIEPDGIWAVDYGLDRTLKRVAVERHDGEIRYVLKSDNKVYLDQIFSPEEVTVFGRYVGRFSVF